VLSDEALDTGLAAELTVAAAAVGVSETLNTARDPVSSVTGGCLSAAAKVDRADALVVFADDAGRPSRGVSVTDLDAWETARVSSAYSVVHTLDTVASAITGVINATSCSYVTVNAPTGA
jgi:hypothetical protein